MRVRTLLAVVAAVGLALVPASLAGAEEEGEGGHHGGLTEEQIDELRGTLGHEEFECLEEQLEKVEAAGAGGAVEALETCEEAPNPIFPAVNEIIWAVISFGVLFFLLAKFGFPAIRKGLEDREQGIRSDLESAEQTKSEADQVLAEYRQQLADARTESARIIEEARQAADAMRRDLQANAEAEAATARERAQAEIDATVNRARADLQREVADFAVTLAERIVDRNLDRDAQLSLIDQYIDEVGGMGGSSPSEN